ncbi:hypothetical protein ABZ946_20190 [Streptomyces sp. NPDC046324]|uniref:bestrophin-like domain n=1 Tax=Streptomyces sp. NPDC046324 TaxID=3154915 RepID=UPI0033D50563
MSIPLRSVTMVLWLLNHLGTLTLAVLIVGGTVLAALAGSVLLRRRHPRLADGEHNDMVGVVLGMFGAIYGIILAFVIVTLWTQMENTTSSRPRPPASRSSCGTPARFRPRSRPG